MVVKKTQENNGIWLQLFQRVPDKCDGVPKTLCDDLILQLDTLTRDTHPGAETTPAVTG
jgi:hypothetical protein